MAERMAERGPPGVERVAEPPLWRSSAAGPLLAIALLVAATVGASVWLSIIDQRREEKERLTREAHHAALQIRGRLVETEQMLLLEGAGYAASTKRFLAHMEELLQANAALLRVELRRRDGTPIAALDAPAPRAALPPAMREPLSAEARAAFDTAIRTHRLTYSQPYFVQLGETGFDLMELVVPTGEPGGPVIVATYAPQRILDHFVVGDAPRDLVRALVEADGTIVARQSTPGEARGPQHATAPLARNGATVLVRVEGLRHGPRLAPDLMTGLVAATTVGLGLAMFLLMRDIRRRERAERSLREQVRFRRAVEDAMQHALLVQDLAGIVVHVNDAASRLTGYSREALVGSGPPLPFFTDAVVSDHRDYLDRIERAGDADAQTERERGFETTIRRRDGESVAVHVIETTIRHHDGRPAGRMVLAADLTDRKRMEDHARRQQEALQTRSRLALLGEMASTLSHELNQPLAAITSYAAACENLVDAQPTRPESVRQALRGIRAQAERAGRVIRSVQSFLRRRAIEREEVDLSALLRGLEPLLRLQATRTGARIEFEVAPGTTAWVDRVMLEQVLLNLTRNGFEAMVDTPPQDRVLAVGVTAVTDPERGERVRVTVTDRGRGVPADAVPQLGTAFFTTKDEGMGLGLSLCRSVVEQHGGNLQYRPRPGGGATFSFDLPRRGEPVKRSPARETLGTNP
jgi:two-component system sensor histidine kinase DctS